MSALLFVDRQPTPLTRLAVPAMNFGQIGRFVPSDLRPYALVLDVCRAITLVAGGLDATIAEWLDEWTKEPPDEPSEARLSARIATLGEDFRRWPKEVAGAFIAFAYGPELLAALAAESPRERPFVGAHTLDAWRATPGHLGFFGRCVVYPVKDKYGTWLGT